MNRKEKGRENKTEVRREREVLAALGNLMKMSISAPHSSRPSACPARVLVKEHIKAPCSPELQPRQLLLAHLLPPTAVELSCFPPPRFMSRAPLTASSLQVDHLPAGKDAAS